jgi:hypothetical protein
MYNIIITGNYSMRQNLTNRDQAFEYHTVCVPEDIKMATVELLMFRGGPVFLGTALAKLYIGDKSVIIRSKMSGVVDRVLIADSEMVFGGQVIFELRNTNVSRDRAGNKKEPSNLPIPKPQARFFKPKNSANHKKRPRCYLLPCFSKAPLLVFLNQQGRLQLQGKLMHKITVRHKLAKVPVKQLHVNKQILHKNCHALLYKQENLLWNFNSFRNRTGIKRNPAREKVINMTKSKAPGSQLNPRRIAGNHNLIWRIAKIMWGKAPAVGARPSF